MAGISIVNVFKEGVTLKEKDFFKNIIKDEKQENTFTGKNNSYLDYVALVVNSSPIGSACLKVIKDFVAGQGIKTSNFLTKKISIYS